ncbi:hypothetical protein EDEG_01500 [Edhazardia aedis USNM 41457]|uniref:Uncharacterized protein n=1 Tax=Edhazardia aedis (strain USNM 41457) TaxID=1003232 RepID=J9D8X3_EDHAE|nr:hypothetical protein EDEG_01500 [Edhazardia aedis USNM 41457]|eukprot:EJW04211.1 hypothetical protein EDEG_01500 [Edhazardia aedis USNM 41457]
MPNTHKKGFFTRILSVLSCFRKHNHSNKKYCTSDKSVKKLSKEYIFEPRINNEVETKSGLCENKTKMCSFKKVFDDFKNDLNPLSVVIENNQILETSSKKESCSYNLSDHSDDKKNVRTEKVLNSKYEQASSSKQSCSLNTNINEFLTDESFKEHKKHKTHNSLVVLNDEKYIFSSYVDRKTPKIVRNMLNSMDNQFYQQNSLKDNNVDNFFNDSDCFNADFNLKVEEESTKSFKNANTQLL